MDKNCSLRHKLFRIGLWKKQQEKVKNGKDRGSNNGQRVSSRHMNNNEFVFTSSHNF